MVREFCFLGIIRIRLRIIIFRMEIRLIIVRTLLSNLLKVIRGKHYGVIGGQDWMKMVILRLMMRREIKLVHLWQSLLNIMEPIDRNIAEVFQRIFKYKNILLSFAFVYNFGHVFRIAYPTMNPLEGDADLVHLSPNVGKSREMKMRRIFRQH